ncbi:MAG: tetratricopeptide repeat protein [Pseudomonadota bacterium]
MKRSIATLALVAVPCIAWSAPTAMAPPPSMDTASAAALEQSIRLIEADRYCDALPLLEELAVDVPDNADVFNLLGYVYRKMDDLEVSAVHYARALSLDPNHLATLAYQGQLFLQQGEPDKALANLARLETLCGSCEERLELETAIDAHPTR